MKLGIPKNIKELKQHLNDPLFKNSYFSMATTVIGSLLGFIFWVLVARYYTPHDIGLASALISTSSLLVTFSIVGFDFGILRFLPNEKDKQGMINSCLTITFFLSILLSAIFILGIDIWSQALSFIYKSMLFLLFFIVLVFTTALTRLQWSVFLALRTAELSFIHNTTLFVLKLLFVPCLVAFGVFGIISAWTLAACIALLVSIFFLTPRTVHLYQPILTIKKRVIKDMFHISFGNYIAGNFSAIPTSVLPLMIINILSPEMNAYFFIALGILNPLLMIPVSVSNCLFVEGSYAPEQFRKNVIKTIKFTFFLIIPSILGIFVLGDKLLLLFGKVYSENGFYMLCILVLSLIPFTINQLYMTIKNVQIKVNPIIYLNALIAILTIGLSYVLMIEIGVIGAAIGYTLGQGIAALVVFAAVWREGWI